MTSSVAWNFSAASPHDAASSRSRQDSFDDKWRRHSELGFGHGFADAVSNQANMCVAPTEPAKKVVHPPPSIVMSQYALIVAASSLPSG
jgi:hypothetical protein